MLSSSGSSKRLLVFHGSSPHRSKVEKRLSSVEKNTETTSSAFNLEDLNNEMKLSVMTKSQAQFDKAENELRSTLAAKEEMLEFYKKYQQRRRERFEREYKEREATLTETLNNLRNLVNMEAYKNFKLYRKIEAIRSGHAEPNDMEIMTGRQPLATNNSQLFGYSDYNCFEISKSYLMQRRDETLLLESMNGSSLTLANYL